MNTIRDAVASLFNCCLPTDNRAESTESSSNAATPLPRGEQPIYRTGKRPTHPDLYRLAVVDTAPKVPSATSSAGCDAHPIQQSMSVTRYRQPSHVGSATAPVGTGSHEETASIKEPIQQSRIKSASEAWPIFSGYSPEAQQTIKIVYDEIRHYHGTSAVSKKGIQRDGFDTNKKTAGSTVAYLNSEETSEMREKATQEDVDNFVLNAATHNYVTPDKDEAKSYAKLADGNHPALVRVGLGDNTVSLEPDPDLLDVVDPDDRDGMGYRTKDSIPSKYVFSSKSKDLSNLDGNVSNSLYSLFQTELENNGITVSKEDVPFLFQEVQSDSENDFDSENGSVFAH